MKTKTLIIIDPTDKRYDTKLHNILRSCARFYATVYLEDPTSCCKTKRCIWYLAYMGEFSTGLIRKEIKCPYKMMTEHSFECNCTDIDLLMIEDVWKRVSWHLP